MLNNGLITGGGSANQTGSLFIMLSKVLHNSTLHQLLLDINLAGKKIVDIGKITGIWCILLENSLTSQINLT
jgi:hypothetical protein